MCGQALPRAPNGLKAGQFPELSPQRTQRTQRRTGGGRGSDPDPETLPLRPLCPSCPLWFSLAGPRISAARRLSRENQPVRCSSACPPSTPARGFAARVAGPECTDVLEDDRGPRAVTRPRGVVWMRIAWARTSLARRSPAREVRNPPRVPHSIDAAPGPAKAGRSPGGRGWVGRSECPKGTSPVGESKN